MPPNLRVKHKLQQGQVLLRALSGKLDETFDPAVVDPGGCRHLILDLADVSHVASYGVREWVRALASVRSQLDGLYFVQVSPRMTDQFNMIMGFDGGGSLLTFRAYYICDACGEESVCLFDTQLDRSDFESLDAPSRQCKICGHDADLDDDPSVLFEYVRSTELTPPPAAVVGVLRSQDSWIWEVPGVRLSTRQAVEANVAALSLAGIINDSFPTRRLVETASEPAYFFLNRVTHFDRSGFDRWRSMIYELAKTNNATFANCPPVILRRLVEDPTLLGPVPIKSVWFPAVCRKCKIRHWRPVELRALKQWFASPPKCPTCSKSLDVRDRQEDFVEFARVLRDAPTQVAAPPKPEPKRTTGNFRVPDQVRENFAEKYEILCKLAEGGMAEVYLVRQHGAMGFRRVSVIKTIRSELLTDDRMIRLFLDEAKLAARIDYPHVIRVYDLGRTEGAYYMVLEFVHGRNLSEVMRNLLTRGATVPPALAASIVADLCKGLARAHQPDSTGSALVHRDVTPNNVLVSFDGVVKLVDFGLAGHRRTRHDKDVILGNPSWLAPESYLGGDVTPQTDLWGAGLLLLSMITGKNPFRKSTIEKSAAAIVHEKITRPWQRPKVPRRLFSIIARCLEKDSTKRPADALSLEADLRRVIPKLGGDTNIPAWINKLFARELQLENELAQRCKASSFVDALLTAEPAEIQRFFRLMQEGEG